MRRVIALGGIEDLPIQVAHCNLPVFQTKQLLNEHLKVVLSFDEEISGLLESDVQFSLDAHAVFFLEGEK